MVGHGFNLRDMSVPSRHVRFTPERSLDSLSVKLVEDDPMSQKLMPLKQEENLGEPADHQLFPVVTSHRHALAYFAPDEVLLHHHVREREGGVDVEALPGRRRNQETGVGLVLQRFILDLSFGHAPVFYPKS